MPDDRGRDPEDLDQVLFDDGQDAPSYRDDGDLDTVLFGSDDATGAGTTGAAVGYAPEPLSRIRRIFVGLAVVALGALVVMATVAFANGSSSSTTKVRIPAGSNATSTSVGLRTPSSLPGASTPDTTADTAPATSDRPAGTTATTRRRTTPTTGATSGAPTDPPGALPSFPSFDFPSEPPTEPTTTKPPTTTEPPTTTTTTTSTTTTTIDTTPTTTTT